MVTSAGAAWIAMSAIAAGIKPGDGATGWRLAVKSDTAIVRAAVKDEVRSSCARVRPPHERPGAPTGRPTHRRQGRARPEHVCAELQLPVFEYVIRALIRWGVRWSPALSMPRNPRVSAGDFALCGGTGMTVPISVQVPLEGHDALHQRAMRGRLVSAGLNALAPVLEASTGAYSTGRVV